MTSLSMLSKYIIFACIFTQAVLSYQPKNVIYWGQESQGKEQPLRTYCASGDYDIIVMGFAYEFPTPSDGVSAYPALNFASHCETPHDSNNPHLLICPTIAADITYCQGLGVQILLSFGGGVGRYGFTSDAQAVTFATLVWNMFFEGTDSSVIRPFGTTIIDGVDLDIEGGGTTGYIAFINKMRSYYATSRKTYYISSAPQCFYPDGRLGPGTGTALTGGWFDYVFVQFYNNYCGLEFTPYLSVPQLNFNTWAQWARTGAVNPNVRVFLGAPAAAAAVGAGYIPIANLSAVAAKLLATYPDVYGGVMLWDTSNSDRNNNFGHQVAAFIRAQGAASSTPVAVPPPVVISTPPVVVSPPAVVSTGRSTTATPPVATTGGSTTATAPVATTGVAPVVTTGLAPVVTTGSAPVVSAGQPASQSSTTGVASTVPSKQPTQSSSSTSSSTSTSSSSTPCTAGYMKCLTSETYSKCDRGVWQQSQSCQHGLTCTPTGNYIYCIR